MSAHVLRVTWSFTFLHAARITEKYRYVAKRIGSLHLAIVGGVRVVKVGVTCIRYVCLEHARPWLIHAYRNIKGRGLHVEEEGSNVPPMSTSHEESSTDTQSLTNEQGSDFIQVEETSEPAVKRLKTDQHASPLDATTKLMETADKSSDEPDVKKMKLDTADKEEAMGVQQVALHEGKDINDPKTAVQDFEHSNVKEKPVEVSEHSVVESKHAEVFKDSSGMEVSSEANEVVEIAKLVNDEPEEEKGQQVTNQETTNAEDVQSQVENGEKEKVKQTVTAPKELEIEETKSEMNDQGELGNTEKDVKTSEKLETEETPSRKNDKGELQCAGQDVKADELQTGGTRSKRTRKRRMIIDEVEEKPPEAAVSTYDKVRLVIQPWRKPEGGINKPILKMMLESVMLFLMMNPGSSEKCVLLRYAPYLQPMVLENIVQILEDIGCVTRKYLKVQKASLFSKPSVPEIYDNDAEDRIPVYLPTEVCLFRLGQFGKELFPDAKWPHSTTM